MSTGKILTLCTKYAHFFCEVGTESNIYMREMLLHEIDILNPEAFSVQVIEISGIGGEGEGQLVGIQGLIFPVAVFVQLSVFSVAQQRMAGVGELSADLMGAAGNQLTFHKAQAVGGR